jgi:pilus assembly protein Flp/PilA
MKAMFLKFAKDERGLTTVEYAVAGGLIALAVVGAFQLLGGTVEAVITQIDTILQAALT